MMGLTIFSQAYYKRCKNLKSWRLTYIFPIFLGLFHFLFFSFKGDLYNTRYFFGLFYLSAIICELPLIFSIPFFIKRFPKIQKLILPKIILPLVTTFCILANLHTIFMPSVYNSGLRNHTRQSYTKSFISATKDMEKYYSLKEWKQIDIPALREKFLPVVELAENTQDEGLLAATMVAYTYNFYDGHVSISIKGNDPWQRCHELLAGNDYGLSLLRLSDGKTIAVNVEENSEAWNNGIRNQTIITGWNNQKIDEAIEETEFIYIGATMPVKATEDLFKPIMLATKGYRENGRKGIVEDLMENASITDDSQRPPAYVSFIDENGNEQTVQLKALGNGINRFEITYILLCWCEYMNYPDLKNYETVMINNDTAYMPRYCEQINLFYDVLSYFTNRNPKARQKYIDELTARKNDGMKKLIIDARSNMGGFWANGIELASLFTNEPFDFAKRGTELFNKKKMLQTITVPADGRFSDIEVLVLVNHYCVSSGDALVRMLQACPNVKVIGLTPSNCSCQEVGGRSVLSNSICQINYPINWLYEIDETTRYIDTDKSRECTVPLDYQIPLTYELAQSLYDNWQTRDILLEYAIDYLK